MNTKQNPGRPVNRRLTLSSKQFLRGMGMYSRHYVHFPALLLAGKWLQDCGFKEGQHVDVSCEEGRLTITLTALLNPCEGGGGKGS